LIGVTASSPIEIIIIESKEDREARFHYQWMLIQETLMTERNYVANLRLLVSGEQSYEAQLRVFSAENNLDQTPLDQIFFPLFDILTLHETFLARLDEVVHNWKHRHSFGALFSEFKEEFECYTNFAKMKSDNQDAIGKMGAEGSPYWEKFSLMTA